MPAAGEQLPLSWNRVGICTDIRSIRFRPSTLLRLPARWVLRGIEK
jgi:hypothetical protein